MATLFEKNHNIGFEYVPFSGNVFYISALCSKVLKHKRSVALDRRLILNNGLILHRLGSARVRGSTVTFCRVFHQDSGLVSKETSTVMSFQSKS